MLVRQCKNTFIRFYDDKGYITNQLTRYDRSYNETGADFLREISRKPVDVKIILSKLNILYGKNVSLEKLEDDFLSFLKDLERNKFLVTGQTPEECDIKDLDFSYSLGNMKTQVYDFIQQSDQEVNENTLDYMLESDQKNPHLKSIQFEISSRCNERCVHCYIPSARKNAGKDMDFNLFKSILDDFADMGGLHVTLSGGEAFLNRDIIRMLRYCREKDMEICILSNLVFLKDEQIPILKSINISYIQASLYSMNPIIHDKITRTKGSFIKTKSAIEKLVQADIPVQISCPLMKENKDGYREVLNYAHSLNIKAFSDYILMAKSDLNTDNLKHRLSLDETEKVIRDIIENDTDYPKWIKKKRPILENLDMDRYSKQPLCGVAINNLCISENGDIYPCPGWQALVVGNALKEKLQHVWKTSEKLSKLRSVIQSDFPKCLKCEARNYCTRCLERNFNEHQGNMYSISEHNCQVAFLTKRIHEEYQAKGYL